MKRKRRQKLPRFLKPSKADRLLQAIDASPSRHRARDKAIISTTQIYTHLILNGLREAIEGL